MFTFREFSGQRVVVEPLGQVIRAELDDQAGYNERPPMPPAPAVVRSAADIVVLETGHRWQAPLHATVASAGLDETFTPFFALTAKAKRFDDRLYAALEGILHDGAAEHSGLFALIEEMRARLSERTRPRGLLDAAGKLLGRELTDGIANIHARKWLAGFVSDAKKSKPIGFYTESEELSRIFRYDRLLQSELAPEDADAFANLLDRDLDLRARYHRHLGIVERLTGPRAWGAVDDRDARTRSVLPPSDSAEGRLIKLLFGTQPVPAEFRLADELVVRIRDGRLTTVPRPNDGWYAHQFHAIAALLSPETEGLEVGPRYRSELEETFKALFALNRETHVKQLELGAAGGLPPIVIAPRVTIEPLPELYARTAGAYRFIRETLTELLGEHVLRNMELDGLDGFDALVDIEQLFAGAEAVCRSELGQRVPTNDAARAHFRAWQRRSTADDDLQYDLRVAVPLWHDVTTNKVRIAATLGLETRTLRLDWVTPPGVEVFGQSSSPYRREIVFDGAVRSILSPITIECDVREPPSRTELRELCERERTPDAIRAALEAR